MAMRKPVCEWRPEVKNHGVPLGPIKHAHGDWDGFHSHGTALSFADDHGERLVIVGPLAEYAREVDRKERAEIRARLAAAKKEKCPDCRHLLTRHGPGGCEARYSAGPSGTFRCPCERKRQR